MSFHVPEKFRLTSGRLASSTADGNNGAFVIRLRHAQTAMVLASDGAGWEHVSVSRTDRCLNWEEMCQVKAMFWGPDDCVLQFHPPESEYVNNHPFCLHLWRPIGVNIPTPDHRLVGIKDLS
ncbi:MAG: hypothetical protein V4508_02375 [Pseudomonadota bacterium]